MPDDEPPVTEEELAASKRLRDALDDASIPSAEADLARSLRAAWEPPAIDDEELRAIAEGSAVTDEERARASELRDALERPPGAAVEPRGEAALARAPAAAYRPGRLSDDEHRAIVARAIGASGASALDAAGSPRRSSAGAGAEVVALRPRRSVVRIAFGAAASGLALAAGIFLVVTIAGGPGAAELPLAKARSTQPLFTERFKPGEASARIDRIVLARASDYRDNRFAKWGVR
jgi:hypothetical protein